MLVRGHVLGRHVSARRAGRASPETARRLGAVSSRARTGVAWWAALVGRLVWCGWLGALVGRVLLLEMEQHDKQQKNSTNKNTDF